MTGQIAIAAAVGTAAVVQDLAARRISNWIPLAALAGGVCWHATISGWRGVLAALLGAAAGFGVFLVFYLLGGMGGGDVKLMAGFGSLLGAGRLLEAALWAAAVGGLMALCWLAVRAARRGLTRLRSDRAGQTSPDGKQEEEPASESIPYAPAITLGAWLSLIPRG
ncbi:MAG: A24 family peptidase [Acidobacteria bacterium]|nr:A24 family peptidase [Acidobacteriota bacterium]